MSVSMSIELGSRKFKIKAKNIFFFILMISVFMETNATFHEIPLLRYSAILALCMFALLYKVYSHSVAVINEYIGWIFFTLGIFFLSRFWSVDAAMASQNFKNFFIIAVICITVLQMVEEPEDVMTALKAMLVAYTLNALYVVGIVGVGNLGQARLGSDYGGLAGWNANSIGEMTSFSCLISLLFYLRFRPLPHKKIQRTCLLILAAAFLGLSFYTGSRKSILYIVLVFLFTSVFYGNFNEKFKHILIYTLAALLMIYFIMTNPRLYDLIGARMVRMIQEILGIDTGEYSMGLRAQLILKGWHWFLERPWFGYGLANFIVIYRWTYSHCNFIEILVSVGIVGFVIFYYIYVHIIVMLAKLNRADNDLTTSYFLAVILVLLMMNMAVVCYESIDYNLVLLCGFCWAKIRRIEDKHDKKSAVCKQIFNRRRCGKSGFGTVRGYGTAGRSGGNLTISEDR